MSALHGQSILIVEDEPLIAVDMHAALSETGASIIAALNRHEALLAAANAEISAAILDIKLGGCDCSLVCTALTRRHVPFMFYTGYRNDDVRKVWPWAPLLVKPATREQLLTYVLRLLKKHTTMLRGKMH